MESMEYETKRFPDRFIPLKRDISEVEAASVKALSLTEPLISRLGLPVTSAKPANEPLKISVPANATLRPLVVTVLTRREPFTGLLLKVMVELVNEIPSTPRLDRKSSDERLNVNKYIHEVDLEDVRCTGPSKNRYLTCASKLNEVSSGL